LPALALIQSLMALEGVMVIAVMRALRALESRETFQVILITSEPRERLLCRVIRFSTLPVVRRRETPIMIR